VPGLEVRKNIPSSAEAAGQARRVLDPFVPRIPEHVLIDARIVLSELVTNSYKHSEAPEGSPIEVTVRDSKDVLRVEVVDRTIFDPTPESTEELRDAKWGLSIVDRVSDNWGRISEGGIWAEFGLDPSKH
jgi:anti-sigma regulatory factor (Ser/Thr protein kinase)